MKLSKMTIAQRYGKALFELAEENSQRQPMLIELLELKKTLQQQPELLKVLDSKRVSYQEKRTILQILVTAASPLVANLLQMLFDYDRIDDLAAIIDEYVRLNDQLEKTVHAQVVTAIALDEVQKTSLMASFAKVVGANKVILEEKVDPEIIGGVVLKSNNHIYNGSLRLKLERIKRLLLK
ncbi:ATP synthase F1 subunit delta [Liquorilactobacillus sicerae]|uniref:ATP synthase F1 subunit delta n=1 Tax=Liquorilactobacillus sicerae TaxID=1416943 RepID=UPI00247FB014|nr:ATP synthase F1 subunit delta [Liquorilactobacillus sicerae]